MEKTLCSKVFKLPPGTTSTIHFVRHGLVHNPDGIFYGRLPRFGLSEEGFRQARALAPFFTEKPIRAVVASPLLRARQTAGVVAGFIDHLSVKTSTWLLECHTPYEGRLLSDLEAKNWDLYSGTKPPYEQPADIFRRSCKFIHRMLKEYPGQQIVGVTHADLIVFLSLWANGYAVNYQNKSLIEHRQIPIKFPSPASVTSLTWTADEKLPRFQYYEAGNGS